MASQPTFTWAVASGVGSIDSSSGIYTASSAFQAAATVHGFQAPSVTSSHGGSHRHGRCATVATVAAGSPSPVTGTTTSLSVLASDSDGGGEANLTYTWSTTGTPPAA